MRFISSSAYEDDPGFREEILQGCRNGMLVIGVLSVVCALANMGAYVIAGKALRLSPGDPATSVVVWDRLTVMVLGIVYTILARTRSGPRWGRLVGAFFVLLIGLVILVDDIIQGEQEFYSDRYLGAVMLVVIALVPYQPRRAVAFIFGVWGVYLVSYAFLPGLMGFEARLLGPGLLIYILIVMFFCIGLSTFLYTNRYGQYQARRKAEQLGEQIAEMERVKSRFFANVSHEFRTPLSLILGPVEDALCGAYGPVTGALEKHLRLMQRSGLRLQRLINQLLDLSKLEAGRMHLHVRPHNLNTFLRYVVSSFSSLAQRKHIQLAFEAGEDDHLLYFDADKVEQVVTNLLSNALKFTPEHGKVHVSLQEVDEEEGAYVEIYVRDTGPGIPKEALPYVFDRFHQADEAATPGHVGTGIGLALAKELVALHRGGSIRAESEPGFGSTFIVRLLRGSAQFDPQDLVEASSDVGLDEASLGAEDLLALEEVDLEPVDVAGTLPEDAPTVLIVDDDADMREYLHSLLGSQYHVEEAGDGVEGLEKTRSVQPDLVLSDVLMPRLDGYALCRAVKGDETLDHIPVILLTAKGEREAEREGFETGADDYIYKPFYAGTLRARVENLIELRRHLRHRFSEEVVLQPSAIAVSSADAAFLERVRTEVEARMENSNFGVEWLADEVGVSPRHLQRKLKALTRLSTKGFINMMRLQRAAQLLERQAGTVSEIAYGVGFQDANYFSKLFKQTFGVSPSAFSARSMGQIGQNP